MKTRLHQDRLTDKIQALSNLFYERYEVLTERDIKEFEIHIENAFSLMDRRATKR